MIRLFLLLTATSLGLMSFWKINDQKTNNNTQREQMVLQGTIQFLSQVHYDPKPLDDEYSVQIYKNYINSLDYNKRFLTQEDIALLSPYEKELDDQLVNLDLTFFEKSLEVWDNAYPRAKALYQIILDQPLNLHDNETLELDIENLDYASTPEDLKELWRKRLEFELISRMKRYQEDENYAEVDLDSLQRKAIHETRDMYDRYFANLEELRRSDRFEDFVNAITTVADPHSNYFSPKDKQNFDIGMSGKLEGIGAQLSKDGDYTKVNSLIIGGPAWKAKELEANDLILKVAQEDHEWIDIAGWRLDDVVQKIRGKSGTTVFLFIKKKDGTTKEISIVRDEVEIGEQFAKSYIIHTPKDNAKIGYINLPKFYSDFSSNGKNCASDVALEIEKLKKDSIQGIVLDLRSNPGGSLRDVVDMGGLFIEKGPIVQALARNKTQRTILEDKDKSVAYDGPLLIMVNQFSASASEILAAAMQDYNRAIIVGVGNSTYGKGTVQRFFSLDKSFSKILGEEKLGDIKMTIQKYYRVNGSSVQNKGVIPDIALPGKYDYIPVGEKEYETSMPWDETETTTYDQKVHHLDIEKLAGLSHARVDTSHIFSLIKEQANFFRTNKDNSIVPLHYEEYKKSEAQKTEDSKKFNNIFQIDSSLVVYSTSIDEQKVQADSALIAKVEQDVKGLQKDLYLMESLNIMEDALNQDAAGTKLTLSDKAKPRKD